MTEESGETKTEYFARLHEWWRKEPYATIDTYWLVGLIKDAVNLQEYAHRLFLSEQAAQKELKRLQTHITSQLG